MTTQRAILLALDRVEHRLLHELTLLADVNCILSEPITIGTLRRECADLESHREIKSVHNEREKTTKFGITDNGRARLAE